MNTRTTVVRRIFGDTLEDALLALLLATAVFLAAFGVRSCYAHEEHASTHTAAPATAGHHS